MLAVGTARKSTSLTWSDLSISARTSFFVAWSCDRTQVDESGSFGAAPVRHRGPGTMFGTVGIVYFGGFGFLGFTLLKF